MTNYAKSLDNGGGGVPYNKNVAKLGRSVQSKSKDLQTITILQNVHFRYKQKYKKEKR